MPVNGIDGEERIARMSPTGTKQKPSKSLVRTFRRFSFKRIPASSYPRWFIKCSSVNVSECIECSNARSMDTRQSLKAFYVSIWYDCPVVHSSLLHCKLYILFKWRRKITDFLEDQQISLRENSLIRGRYWYTKLYQSPTTKQTGAAHSEESANANTYSICTLDPLL